jgi:muramoyltetrapeptide carboxypeptidase
MSENKKQPRYLKPGDQVAIVSPSFAVEEKKLVEACHVLEKWGLKVHIGRNVLNQNGPFAGTDEERLRDLQEATANRGIRAVLCSRGGYGIARIINKVDFSPLEEDPKWYAGFSDITFLHLWLSEVCGIMSIHGDMPLNFSNPEKKKSSFRSLRKALFGEFEPVEWKGSFHRAAEVSGEMTGGNLSLVYSSTGTRAEPDTKGRILFLEDVGENYYHIDRMLTSLKLAGKFEGLAALIVGGMNKIEDTKIPWGKSMEETIAEVFSGYDYPLFFDFPAGHSADNRAFYIGRTATVSPDGRKATLSYE